MVPKQSKLHIKGYFKNKENSWKNFKKEFYFLKENGLTNRLIIFTIFFRLLTSFLSIVGIGLLLPLTKGIISQDFGFILNSSIYKSFSNFFPVFSSFGFLQIFFLFVFLIFLATILKNLILYYGGLYLTSARLKIASKTNQFVFNNYLRLGKPFYDVSEGSSESFFFMRFSATVKKLLDNFDSIIDVVIQIISLSIVMILVSFKLYLLAVVFIFPVLVLNKKINETIKKSIVSNTKSENGFPVIVNNSFTRLPLALINNKEKYESKVFMDSCDEFEKKRLEVDKRISLIQPLNEFFILTLLLLLSLFLGLVSYKSSLDVAKGLVFFYAFKQFIGLAKTASNANFGIVRSSTQIKKALDVVSKFEEFIVPSGKKIFKGLKQEISFNNLIFNYPKKKISTLKGVSLSIKKGEVTSIIGRSGSGKSTLVSLLLRLYDCPEKSIFIDGTDIKEYSNKSIRDHISFVNQEPILFKDTIYKNVTYGVRKKVSKKEVVELLNKLRLGPMLGRLKEGVNTQLKNKGVNLSGGEKQRIGLARALLNNSDIIILDEPTSALDALTEAEIKGAVEEFTSGKTVIIIAHRLKTIKGSDRVVVMEEGRVVGSGKIKELLKMNKYFREYWDSQKLD